MNSKTLLTLAVALICQLAGGQLLAADRRPNVLLILVDDLKPALGCYGDRIAKTPNIDALAARGMRFDLAYCNQAVCAPSRFTLMLGSHSTSTGLYGLGSELRQVIPDAITMPQHFAAFGGYRTESLGKVFHIGHGNHGDPSSFSVPHFHDKVIEYLDPASTGGGQLTREEAYFTNQRLGEIRSLPRGAAFESPDVADGEYADGRVANETVARLRAAQTRRLQAGTPFFIAAGFARPHLPFSAPQKYWDLYDPASLPMPENEELPAGSPEVAGKRGGEISNYKPVPTDRNAKFSEQLKRELIHGYYASMSFVDAQIGKVIKELDRLSLADETIVVLWGDHGFHLGDLGIWTKHTNYEQANRIPILISAPGVTKSGSSTRQPAESVDIFPTLAELAGLPAPTGPQPIDGVSLVPVLKDPAARVRDHAYHAYPKRKLGRAIRTQRYRLVEWRAMNGSRDSIEYELYDYQTDPLETRNLAAEKPTIVEALKRTLETYPEPVSRTRPLANRKRAAAAPPVKSPSKQPAVAAAPQPEEDATQFPKAAFIEQKTDRKPGPVMDANTIRAGLSSHDRALYIKAGWIRDPYITIGPDDDYYLLGTQPREGDPREAANPYNIGLGDESIVGDQVRAWRSKDLIEWESLGSIFTVDDTMKARSGKQIGKRLIWAPEAHWLGDRWALVHCPRRHSSLALSSGKELKGPWTHPMNGAMGQRHDPSLFTDDDGTRYLLWGNTFVAPLSDDLTGYTAKPVRIDPAGSRPGPDGKPISRIGHEGATMIKVGGKYVHLGTAWSTDQGRKGSYNLYYSVADKITGPYGPRMFAGRFLGHGTPFRDNSGKWWCTAFFNANVPPLPRDGIESRDLSEHAQTINEQGVTIVPLDVRALDNGEIYIRAKDPAYANPGPDEAQSFGSR